VIVYSVSIVVESTPVLSTVVESKTADTDLILEIRRTDTDAKPFRPRARRRPKCLPFLPEIVATRRIDTETVAVSGLSTVVVRRPTGQSGTAETRHEQGALASKLGVGVRVDEDVDGAVGVRQPDHGEVDSGRRSQPAGKRLRER